MVQLEAITISSSREVSDILNIVMSSHQVELKSMLSRLKQWNQQLGGNLSRNIEGNEFDYLQQQFLVKRHQVEKAQDIRQKQGGVTKQHATLGYEIREGLKAMGELVEKLRAQHHRLSRKKKDPADVLERKGKIVQNCELLLKDLEERETEGMPTNKKKIQTLTDMKLRLLNEIDENNVMIHDKKDSDGRLTDSNVEEDREQINKWKKKDEEMDGAIDDIIVGVRGLKGKVQRMNEAQDIINEKTKKGVDKADKLANRIQGDNEKLKKIIEDFKPNRCCLYVALFLLLVGLVVTILKVLI